MAGFIGRKWILAAAIAVGGVLWVSGFVEHVIQFSDVGAVLAIGGLLLLLIETRRRDGQWR
ncbi:MAG: hypothetical protein JOZ27_06085 [Caulobacteraceae bacterium]|nr:hypothetical protein [Caulobacteraceae bacterium]